MKKSEFNRQLRLAKNAESKMYSACGSLAEMFQPFFNEEISVLSQPDDGFVIMYDQDNSYAPVNEPVNEAFENIKNDQDYYK